MEALSIPHLLIILVIVLVFFGGRRIPDVMKGLARESLAWFDVQGDIIYYTSPAVGFLQAESRECAHRGLFSQTSGPG